MDPHEETKVRTLLAGWGLSPSVQGKFIDNYMDLWAIQRMDKESVIALLGPAHGLRIRFEEHRREWVKSMECQAGTKSVENNLNRSGGEEHFDIVAMSPSIGVSPASQSKTIGCYDFNGNTCELPNVVMVEDEDITASLQEINKALPPTDITGEKNRSESTVLNHEKQNLDESMKTVNLCLVSKTQNPNSLQDKEPSPPVKKNPNSLQDKEPSPPVKKTKSYDIDTALKSYTKGATVLKVYEDEKAFPKDSLRDTLVECIIEYEMSNDMQKIVSRDRLKFLAEEIVKRFPGENMITYFEVYVHPKTKKVCAKGKLVWKYYNTRRVLLECGAILKVKEESASSEVKDRAPGLKDFVMDRSITGSLRWLEEAEAGKVNWEEVTDHWRKTSMARMTLLIRGTEVEDEENGRVEEVQKSTKGRKAKNQKEKGKKKTKIIRETAHQYMSKYRVFEENFAYMLFEIDFQILRPEEDPLALYSEWATLSSYIVEQLKKKDPAFLDDPTLTSGEKTLMTLLNLSKLFPIVTCSLEKRGKKVWRPSHAEVADAFVFLVPSMLELDRVKDERRNKLHSQRLSLQPFVAVVGPKECPQQYLVNVDDFFFEVNSVLQAVDLTFKCFFAVHTPFPPEAEQIWLFLQKAAYGFSTDEDGHFAGVIANVDNYKHFKDNLSKE